MLRHFGNSSASHFLLPRLFHFSLFKHYPTDPNLNLFLLFHLSVLGSELINFKINFADFHGISKVMAWPQLLSISTWQFFTFSLMISTADTSRIWRIKYLHPSLAKTSLERIAECAINSYIFGSQIHRHKSVLIEFCNNKTKLFKTVNQHSKSLGNRSEKPERCE